MPTCSISAHAARTVGKGMGAGGGAANAGPGSGWVQYTGRDLLPDANIPVSNDIEGTTALDGVARAP